MNANAIDIAENLILTGYLREAKKILGAILLDEPDNDRAICYMGIIYTETGENDKAIKTLDYYIQRQTETPEAWEALGCAWFKKGELAKAEEYLKKAESLSPDSPSILRNIGVLYGIQKKDEDSHEYILKSYEHNPYDYRTLYALAYSHITLKQYEEAKTIIEETFFLDFPDEIRKELELILVKLQINWF
ncbi:MAG: tetratricopeptide repeat protein [Spirochaetales bacterium]|nr:tetratricopeptide repeat protein [Spirochaetales bacterium]